MAKKPSAEQAPEAKPVKKTTARKSTSSKSASKKAAEAKDTATKAAITSISAAKPASDAPKAQKKTTPKQARAKAPAKEENKAVQTTEKPSSPSPEAKPAQEGNAAQQPVRTQQPAIQVRRESFRPKPQESRQDDFSPSDGFSQPETVGGETGMGNGRNKRRNRNRNRNRNEERHEDVRQQPENVPSGNNKKIDLGKLSKRAWKIFLAEVTEEGLALMDDNTSREAAKRSFRVAEFFMHEEARRKHPQDQQQRPGFRPNPQHGGQDQQKQKQENDEQASSSTEDNKGE